MRIAFLSPVGVIGGAERLLLDYVESLKRAEPDVEVALFAGADGPLLCRATEIGMHTVALPLPARLAAVGDSFLSGARTKRWRLLARAARAGPAAWRYALRLRRALAAWRPDVIHSNGIKTHLLARIARPAGVPVVWHMHDFVQLRPLVRRALRHATRGVCGVVAISEAVARDARAVTPGLPVEVIPNAVDVNRFVPGAGADLDALAGLATAPSGTVRLGLVATYARWKGQDVFLQAAARLLRDRPDLPVRFYIVGGPIYQTANSQFSESELRALAAELRITPQVGLVPFQDNPAAVYNALDIVVHASTRPEPFGLTIAEAMACGRATIVSAAGGAAELFRDGEDAVGVPPADVQQLALAMCRLAADAALRGRLGAAARAAATARFSRDRLGPQLLAAYRRCLPHLKQSSASSVSR